VKPLIVNLIAGPGAGKSTMAAHVFAELKWMEVNCELVTEFAKEKVWEKSFHVMENQIFLYANQHHNITRVAENVDVVITDSPLILSAFYGKKHGEKFVDFVIDNFKSFWNLNFLLMRKKSFCESGRIHNEDQSREIDRVLKEIMDKNKINYISLSGTKDSVSDVLGIILMTLKERNQTCY